MNTKKQFDDYLVEYFEGEKIDLDNLDSMGWVGLIAFLKTKNIVVDLSLLASVDSTESLFSISQEI